MTEEQLQQLFLADTKGYGIQNVNRRVQLCYGPDYGLAYHSVPGKGTTAELVFPLDGSAAAEEGQKKPDG